MRINRLIALLILLAITVSTVSGCGLFVKDTDTNADGDGATEEKSTLVLNYSLDGYLQHEPLRLPV